MGGSTEPQKMNIVLVPGAPQWLLDVVELQTSNKNEEVWNPGEENATPLNEIPLYT